MKIYLLIFLLWTYSYTTHTTVYKGQVVGLDQNSIQYANIGIAGTRIGTVSKSDGAFELEIPDSLATQNLRVSFVGYKTAEFPIKKLKANPTIILEPKLIRIIEVVKYAPNMETAILGCEDSSMPGEFWFRNPKDTTQSSYKKYDPRFGGALAVHMKIEEDSCILNKIGINIIKLDADSLKLMYEICYADSEGTIYPDSILNAEPIYTTLYSGENFTHTLKSPRVKLKSDFYLVLRLVEAYNLKMFVTHLGLFFTPKILFKQKAQSDFIEPEIPFSICPAIYTEVKYWDD